MLNKQKGITLIALIITIIVMLILVGVTINVVLTGGLFTKAQEGAERTKTETEKEQLLNAVLGTLDDNGKIDLSKIQLPEGFKKVSEDTIKIVYEGPSANQYEVEKESGKIEKIPKEDNENTGEGESIVGLYGNIESLAWELQEQGKGIFYEDGQQGGVQYDDNTITILAPESGEPIVQLGYTFKSIRDEETNEIVNKILYIPDFDEDGNLVFTTNNIEGFILNSYDGKHYKTSDDKNIYFIDGYFENYKGSSLQHKYCVYNGGIYSYDKTEPGIIYLVATINDDGTLTHYTGIIYEEVKTTEQ